MFNTTKNLNLNFPIHTSKKLNLSRYADDETDTLCALLKVHCSTFYHNVLYFFGCFTFSSSYSVH